MSTTLYATNLYITTGPAIARAHNGTVFVNDDVPTGSVLATDKDNNIYVMSWPEERGSLTDPDCWPDRDKDGFIPLYRDYWYFSNTNLDKADQSPYAQSIVNVPRQLIETGR